MVSTLFCHLQLSKGPGAPALEPDLLQVGASLPPTHCAAVLRPLQLSEPWRLPPHICREHGARTKLSGLISFVVLQDKEDAASGSELLLVHCQLEQTLPWAKVALSWSLRSHQQDSAEEDIQSHNPCPSFWLWV